MTKNEALKAAIDGKKIRHKGYRPNNLIYFDGEKFILTNGDVSMDADGPALAHEDGWQLVPEYVDFATAWKAYGAGKEIVSVSHNNIKRKCGTYVNDKNVRFLPEKIHGKWLILEDE